MLEELEPLSLTQRRILRAIREFIARHGYSPSIAEIGDMAGLSSTASVAYQLDVLEERGEITRKSCTPRSVRLCG